MEIDSEFKLRYRIEICPKSPFRRKSRVFEGHKISAKLLGTLGFAEMTEIAEVTRFCFSPVFQKAKLLPKSETPVNP